MLDCRACLWRHLRALEANLPRDGSVGRNAVPSPPYAQRRFYTQTFARHVPALHSLQIEHNGAEQSSPFVNPPSNANSRKEAQSAYAAGMKKKERKSLKRPANVSKPDWNRRARELQYLSDPLELAVFVKRELRKDKFDEMLTLVRMASREGQRIVSWNYIIYYALQVGRVSVALRIYNEVCLPTPLVRLPRANIN